jgi:hypothetical protein
MRSSRSCGVSIWQCRAMSPATNWLTVRPASACAALFLFCGVYVLGHHPEIIAGAAVMTLLSVVVVTVGVGPPMYRGIVAGGGHPGDVRHDRGRRLSRTGSAALGGRRPDPLLIAEMGGRIRLRYPHRRPSCCSTACGPYQADLRRTRGGPWRFDHAQHQHADW